MISIVIVAYNSSRFMRRCLIDIEAQSHRVDEVVIVDNKSTDIDGLKEILATTNVQVRLIESDYNLGFALGANRGAVNISKHSQYVLFLGPDTFLFPNFVEFGIEYLARPENAQVAAVSGKLLGYDIENDNPTGRVDSTGIFQTWYGRWYDRGQGFIDFPKVDSLSTDVVALCATAILCRVECLRRLEENSPYSIFDSSYFMYKEDIELGVRLRQAGYLLRYNSKMIAYHCRGWNRKKMSRRAKILSARNEIQLNAQFGLIKLIYSTVKFYFVLFFENDT